MFGQYCRRRRKHGSAAVATFAWPGPALYILFINLAGAFAVIRGITEIFAAFDVRRIDRMMLRRTRDSIDSDAPRA